MSLDKNTYNKIKYFALADNIRVKHDFIIVRSGINPLMFVKIESEKSIVTRINQLNKMDEILSNIYNMEIFNNENDNSKHRLVSFLRKARKKPNLFNSIKKNYIKNINELKEKKVLTKVESEDAVEEFKRFTKNNNQESISVEA